MAEAHDPYEDQREEGLRERLSRQGEEALGKLAEELANNPIVSGAVSRAFEARQKAMQAQEAAMGAFNIPSASDVERLTRRLRSIGQRLESIEDMLDRLEEHAAEREPARPGGDAVEARLEAIEERLEQIARDLGGLREAVAPGEASVPRSQERLSVSEQ